MLCGVALGACIREPRTAERAVLALAVLGSVAMTALAVLAARSEAPPPWRHGQGSATPAGLFPARLGRRAAPAAGPGTQRLGAWDAGLGAWDAGLGVWDAGLGVWPALRTPGEGQRLCPGGSASAQIAGPSGSLWRGRQRVPKLPTYPSPRLATHRS